MAEKNKSVRRGSLDNWMVKDCPHGQWVRILRGYVYIGSMIFTNTTASGPLVIQMRIADINDETLVMLEAGQPLPAKKSITLNVDNIPIKDDQFFEIFVDQPGLHAFISGVPM